ncbi:hypothetical protein [Bradyrhizobium sp. HKCCYLS20291]|uniref:hypothetical protein n=1 Tax=Bradyrhizobium sp. HKCCYLS20291 TaxID=3420766 RepID=UPI003EBEE8D4
MTIIYIHGVNVRSPEHGIQLEKPFLRWLGAKVSESNTASYEPVYWGDLASDFRWKLASRPRTALLGMGGTMGFESLGQVREAGTGAFEPSPVVDAGPVLGAAAPAGAAVAAPPLSSIPVDRRADFLADFYLAVRTRSRRSQQPAGYADPIADEPRAAGLAAAAAEVAAKWDAVVAQEQSEAARAKALLAAVDQELAGDALVGMGGWSDWTEWAGEVLGRAAALPGDALSTVAAELRPTINSFVANFVGDVFSYLDRREQGGQPGEIPRRVLAALKRAHERRQQTGEKIVVLTHSMGGQLLYDAVTYFAAQDPALAGLEIDHWFTCGSQVSLFAELRLFKGQPDRRGPDKLPRPAGVRNWTNYYDGNDLFGFVMAPVFDGVTDKDYSTGYGLAFAHTGYLARPSFFQALAARL